MKVKICGITNTEDAQMACHLGAHALGFIMHADSPRRIELNKACKIIRQLPPLVTKVALVVNADKTFLKTVIDSHCFNIIQFHGDETAEFCQQFEFPYIKCLRLKSNDDITKLAQPFIQKQASAILLDKWHDKAYGGQGELLQHPLLASLSLPLPIILAGGLNVENVRHRIDQVRPYAVDVSSGVEQTVGKKSADRMACFINSATGS